MISRGNEPLLDTRYPAPSPPSFLLEEHSHRGPNRPYWAVNRHCQYQLFHRQPVPEHQPMSPRLHKNGKGESRNALQRCLPVSSRSEIRSVLHHGILSVTSLEGGKHFISHARRPLDRHRLGRPAELAEIEYMVYRLNEGSPACFHGLQI